MARQQNVTAKIFSVNSDAINQQCATPLCSNSFVYDYQHAIAAADDDTYGCPAQAVLVCWMLMMGPDGEGDGDGDG